jgi:hypothetical protein
MNKDVQAGWSLFKDGILWKKVVGQQIGVLRDSAELFVKQLEASAGPVDFLRGLLLDRIAANCLRQQIVFEVQSTVFPDLAVTFPHRRSAQSIRETFVSSCFVNLLKYENLLNQAFHRDLILLQTLQKVHSIALPVSPSEPPQADRTIIEAQGNVAIANQAVEPAATTDCLAQEIALTDDEEAQDTATYSRNLQLDNKNAGFVDLD